MLREVTPTTPVQVRYRLSPAGRELIAVLHPLVRWGTKWRTEAEGSAGEPGAVAS